MKSKEWGGLGLAEVNAIQQNQLVLPVKISEIAKALNLVVQAATLPAGISGEIRPAGEGKYRIRVNRHDSRGRQRFTVSHEIAHYLLHRDQIGDGISDDVLYRSSLSDSREAEANRLAADILMPIDAVRAEVGRRLDKSDDEIIEELASIFDVSSAAMSIRCDPVLARMRR